MLFENLIQALLIGDINVIELGLLPTDELDTVKNFLRRIVQVVYDDNIVASGQKLQRGEGADISSSSGIRPHWMISLPGINFMRLNSFMPTYPVISTVPAILGEGEGEDDGDDNEGESEGGEWL